MGELDFICSFGCPRTSGMHAGSALGSSVRDEATWSIGLKLCGSQNKTSAYYKCLCGQSSTGQTLIECNTNILARWVLWVSTHYFRLLKCASPNRRIDFDIRSPRGIALMDPPPQTRPEGFPRGFPWGDVRGGLRGSNPLWRSTWGTPLRSAARGSLGGTLCGDSFGGIPRGSPPRPLTNKKSLLIQEGHPSLERACGQTGHPHSQTPPMDSQL